MRSGNSGGQGNGQNPVSADTAATPVPSDAWLTLTGQQGGQAKEPQGEDLPGPNLESHSS